MRNVDYVRLEGSWGVEKQFLYTALILCYIQEFDVSHLPFSQNNPLSVQYL